MKAKESKKVKMVTIPESELLALVAFKLKDRELFPKKVEEAKRIMKNAKFSFS
jgi:hypothetical protein